jgi:predicted nuclease of predicted toxin-antitoxin system
VKLLLDENLPSSAVRRLSSVVEVRHVRDCGLLSATDTRVWEYARTEGFIIVSKDSDFHQRSLLFGQPPKLVWIRRGNCTTDEIIEVLLHAMVRIEQFASDPIESLLVIDGEE